jgi:D-alanyl-lipoteichoic acid acyltransferase DltB (MBOAT superfamily)
MLFNSYEFIFAFLPLTLTGFFVLGLRSRGSALAWLIAASLFFYACWRPVNVLIIAPAILVNYALARALLQLGANEARGRLADAVLALGIVFNVAFLGWFKYRNFLGTAINDIAGTHIVLTQVILPLGISFITFQKIAFLVDVHGGRVKDFSFREYCLFVLFFPQLIAGPIVHFREVMPQFRRVTGRFDAGDLAVGLTLFCFGLFKKAVLADGMAPHVTPVYEAAAAGGPVSLVSAWLAALGFTLQIYFDFSGYSDMALGLGRCVGVRLPPNFDSPLKSSSIIEFWSRWHMTLTRFLTAYLYNPLSLWLTRRRLTRGLPPLSPRRASAGAFLELFAFPTLLTMFVSGLWHGAGYLFVLWGLLHGTYLVLNHGWRLFVPRHWPAGDRLLTPRAGRVLTFLAVMVSMVLFRSANMTAAKAVFSGLVGLEGLQLPSTIIKHAGSLAGRLAPWLSTSPDMSSNELATGIGWIAGTLLIALGLPNTLEIMARFEPALYVTRAAARWPFGLPLEWRPTLGWAAVVAVVAMTAVLRIQGKSEFLYWQF